MIRKGDNVIIRTGAERGKKGQVLRLLSAQNSVIVEGIRLVKRHQKARKAGTKGQIIDKPMPVHISNVALVEGGKPVRVRRKLVGEKWIRVSRKSGKEI